MGVPSGSQLFIKALAMHVGIDTDKEKAFIRQPVAQRQPIPLVARKAVNEEHCGTGFGILLG
jgi:hypothetical protein